MSCIEFRDLISQHLDGELDPRVEKRVSQHVSICPGCAQEVSESRELRRILGTMPRLKCPEDLTTRIRMAASKEGVERRAVCDSPSSWSSPRWEPLKLSFENMMRPVALPALGGLFSTIILFGMLVPLVLFRPGNFQSDVPIMLYQQPTLKSNMLPPTLSEEDIAVELWLDDQGRPVDYEMDPFHRDNPEIRRQIENTLLFTQFEPATAFGQPKPSRLILYFNRRHIDVKG